MSIDLHKLLNPEQYKAVMHKDGPLLIFAGAGSGKTRVITYRIYNMITHFGINPRNILALTFTNKAAGEMKNRVEMLMGFSSAITVSTFHSFGLRLLRYYGEAIGIKRNSVIYDDADQEQLIKKILKKMDFDLKEFKPSVYQNAINRHKDKLITPKKLAEQPDKAILVSETDVYQEYEKQKELNKALDFADLIVKAIDLLSSSTATADILKERFQYILVDEFQDTNFAQYKLLKILTQNHSNICVVGDDDQSIYSWRGAIVLNILNFEKDYKNAVVIKLEKNYRSTQQILDFSNTIVKNNSVRADKKLITDRKFGVPPIIKMLSDEYREAEFVTSKIIELKKDGKYKFKDISIFFRTNQQSRIFEEKFREKQIPYIIIGAMSFYTRKEIKDLTAYLKLIINPDDGVSLLRIINMPKRNIGEVTLNKIVDCAAANYISVFELLKTPEKLNFLSAKIIATLTEFRDMIIKYYERAKTETVETILTDLVEEIRYRDIMEGSDDVRDNSRVGNIDEFINSACEFVRRFNGADDSAENAEAGIENSGATTAKFLEKITMFSETDKIDETKDYVNVMTYHCAKGLEFSVVFMIAMEEELLPHYNSMENTDSLEEERRLCYVGITRAKDMIFFTHACQRSKFGTQVAPKISRFILEAYPQYIPEYAQPRQSSDYSFSGGEKKSFVKHLDFSKKKDTNFYNLEPSRSTSNEPSKPTNGFSAGNKVLHSVFGPGKIVSIEGDRIKVSFPKTGVKLLSLKLAKLTKI